MKKSLFILTCLASMMLMGSSLRAQVVTVTLNPGWNWISYTNTVVMEIDEALGDFVPMEGDRIQSRCSNSIYIRGHWIGSVNHFVPGWGYKYFSTRTEDIEFFFTQAFSTSVTTATPTNVTNVSAEVGGTVSVIEGGQVFLRGVCWDSTPNPDFNSNHTSDDLGIGSFTSTLEDLDPNTIYYVRAYAVSNVGIVYGDEVSFTTVNSNNTGGHSYVDLGLPSGLLWATCNVGATAPEEFGDYFAWGETQPKAVYNWNTYQYCNGSHSNLTKYCTNPCYGNGGFTDDLNTLLPGDDAASANWGNDWRMPTKAEWQELYQNTTHIWTTRNGVNGRLFTASNGNSLFLPAAGYGLENRLMGVNIYGRYWSSSLNEVTPYYSWNFIFGWSNCQMDNYCRYGGQSVRAVRSSSKTN